VCVCVCVCIYVYIERVESVSLLSMKESGLFCTRAIT